MCYSTALARAVELLDWLNTGSNSSVLMTKDQTDILKLELTFLIMFLNYVGDLLTRYEKLQDLSTPIKRLGKNINKLHRLLTSTTETQPKLKSCQFLQLKRAVTGNPFPVDADDAVRHVLDKIKLVKPKMREVMMEVPSLSASCSRLSKAQISNFPRTDDVGALDLLLQNMKELLNDRVDSIALFRDHIQILLTDLELLGSFLTTITKQRHGRDKLDRLWRRIMHVMYEVEYVIDLVVVKEGHFLHHLLWLSDVIKDIKLIKTEINEIRMSDKNMCRIQKHDLIEMSGGPELSQMNAPRIDGEMVGFKDEEEKLVEQLVWGSNQLQIVSIVGMPGLGKTFLTNKVYNNPIIKDHFHVRAWCNVSQAYEKKQLLINILSQVRRYTEEMYKRTNEEVAEEMSGRTDEELAGELKQYILGRKYLVVLDDVWDIEAWDDLKRSFPNDKLGSRIVFTSRFSNLALQARPDSKIHQLRKFSESESWELLKKKIFQKESCPLELLEVGQQIAKRCSGLPLTVVVVAGLLVRTTRNQEQWREVAENLSSYIITDHKRQCMDILELSYKSLPDYLKSCFLYFGAFPEDKEIPAAKLTQLWIAEGFVRKNELDLEYIAEGYLRDLIDRNLIIASKERSIGGVKACLVHDLVREFCLEKAKEEHFLKVIEGSGGYSHTSLTSCSTICKHRRLFVHLRLDEKFLPESCGASVHSLLFFASSKRLFSRTYMDLSHREVASVIHGFKLLRVLDLIGFMFERSFPVKIVLLVQLRYLAISGKCMDVPSSIANLLNLQTFIVGGVSTYVSADTILNMTKLRHLCISHLDFPEVSSIGDCSQLDSLQTLSTQTLSYGGDMKLMRRFPNLKKLRCWFKESWDDSRKCNRLPILDFLSKLESLKISYMNWMDIRHPLEFNLPSTLKKLTIKFFRLRWEDLSVVGKLPNLQVLKLLEEAVEGEEWNMQDAEFPKLKFLKLQLLGIKRWVASMNNFPPIEQLIVSGCDQLEEIPSCLEDISTLKAIKIECCTDSLKIAVNRIQEEQRDLGNEELKVEISECIKQIQNKRSVKARRSRSTR